MRLVDHAVEALRIATALPGGTADPAVLRSRCEAALADFAAAAARAGHQPEGVEAARFALVALIDERAMAPGCPVRQEWLDQPLQLRLFECASGGEEFYHRLEPWRRPRSEAAADVLEVFQTCLALGFRGMMAAEGAEAGRRQLAEQAAAEVLATRRLPEEGLSPHWRPPAATVAELTVPITRRTWVVPLAAVGVVVLVWLATRAWLGVAAAEAMAELR